MNRYSVYGILSAALFAILPFATSRHLFHAAINAKYFVVIAGVLVLALVAATYWYRGRHALHLKNRPLLWAGITLIVAYWLAAVFGVFAEHSIFSDIQRSSGVFFLTHIAILAFIIGEFFGERDWTLLRRSIALSSALFSFFTVLGVEGFGLSGRLLWTNLDINGYTFGNTTFAGTYLLLALAITLIELTRTRWRSRWWYTLFASAALIVVSPVLLNLGNLGNLGSVLMDPVSLLGSARASSATAILLLVFFGGYLLLGKYVGEYKKIARLGWGSLFVVSIVVGVALLFMPGSVVQEKYIETSTGARILVWQGAFESFKDRPMFGWGPENFEQALQGHFDNRLYQDEYIGEIWFDRAHNVIMDILVSVGLAGVLAHLVIVGALVYVVYCARVREFLGEKEAVLLYALPLAHFLQLQTGFDTVGSYALLGVIAGYGLWLERRMNDKEFERQVRTYAMYYKASAALIAFLVPVSFYITVAELNRQYALYRIFATTNSAYQLELAGTATSRLSSFESLRLASASLLEGTAEEIAEGKATKENIEAAQAQMNIYEERYDEYIEKNPTYYRARVNLAYLYSIQTALGENKIANAREVIANAHELSPQSLITPAMEALLELYSGNLASAKAKAQELVALNPDVPFGHEVLSHIEKQEQTFPTISVFRLTII